MTADRVAHWSALALHAEQLFQTHFSHQRLFPLRAMENFRGRRRRTQPWEAARTRDAGAGQHAGETLRRGGGRNPKKYAATCRHDEGFVGRGRGVFLG
jgi:hypothetical protein